jgi:hypothetical protein
MDGLSHKIVTLHDETGVLTVLICGEILLVLGFCMALVVMRFNKGGNLPTGTRTCVQHQIKI